MKEKRDWNMSTAEIEAATAEWDATRHELLNAFGEQLNQVRLVPERFLHYSKYYGRKHLSAYGARGN